ncbi:MAG: hypothetical protein IPL26_07365 [Leptospiraceae bacterium]|nr:hypothetical protein [Leptospiraceae bacterium]
MGIQAAKVKRVVFLIDACRSPLPEAEGESGEKGEKALSANSKLENEKEDISNTKEIKLKQNILSVRTDKLPKRVLEAEGITMLIGAAPEVSSLEDEDFKSGIFTHFLKKAFNGGVQEENQEEYITEENLSRYIEDRFKHYYELRKKESESAAEPKLYNLTFDRGKKGELLLTHHRPIEGKERIDKPIYTDTIRKREVKGKLVYNEKGEREDLRFFVHDKKRDLYYPDSLDGVYKMEYGFKKDKVGELENFTANEFNLENEEVFEYGSKLIPDVGWEYRGLYNASNTATDRMDNDGKNDHRKDVYRKDINRKDLINQVPTVDPVPTMASQSTMLTSVDKEKIRFEKKIYDFNGNVISEEYFDSKGQPLEFAGVAKTVRAYDKDGQVILEEFYSKETLDEYGDVAEPGKLVAKDGFARYKAQYKSKGNLLLETWEDVEGNIANNQFGFSKIEYVYDNKDRLTQKNYYDKETKKANDKWGVSVYSYSYDSNCIGMYESKITEITKTGNMIALEDWKLGKYKLCLSNEVHTDKEGKPAGDEKIIYKKIRAFNEKGLLISEENFRPENNRRHLENGVAKVEYAHDQEGNIISRKNYGEYVDPNTKEPTPVSDGNGVHEYRFTYKEYFSYDGKPILNECMYHRKDKGILIEPYGCALKIEHFGIDGKPIENKQRLFRTSIYYTGAYQEEVGRLYYRLNAILLFGDKIVKYNTNPFGNPTLYAKYEIQEGKEVLVEKDEYKYDEKNNRTLGAEYETKEGKEYLVSKSESKYDTKNNNTSEVKYRMQEGKEALVEKKEYKYDDRNNKTLEARYETREGAEVLVRKFEFKYDDRNNTILEAFYFTKEGKEILDSKTEYKYDNRNNKILEAYYNEKEGKEILVRITEHKYDDRNNEILNTYYNIEEGKKVLQSKDVFKFDEKNNKTLYAFFYTKNGKEALVKKEEYKFDEKNNVILEAYYEEKDGKEILVRKKEYKYDGNNKNTLMAKFETNKGKVVLVEKHENKYDEKNKITVEAVYDTKEGKEVLIRKTEYKSDDRNNRILYANYKTKKGELVLITKIENKYDDRNNKTLTAEYLRMEVEEWEEKEEEVTISKTEYKYDEKNNQTLYAYYVTREGKEVLISKEEYKYDEKNNKTFFVQYLGPEETLAQKKIVGYRLKSYASMENLYKSKRSQLKEKFHETKDESEKKIPQPKTRRLTKRIRSQKEKIHSHRRNVW